MRRGRALRHPDRSAPRLGLRFAVGTGHLCQIKFWLMQIREVPVKALTITLAAGAALCGVMSTPTSAMPISNLAAAASDLALGQSVRYYRRHGYGYRSYYRYGPSYYSYGYRPSYYSYGYRPSYYSYGYRSYYAPYSYYACYSDH